MSHDANSAGEVTKVAVAWAGALIGTITLQQIVLALTAVYTVLQIYVVVRDKVMRRREADEQL